MKVQFPSGGKMFGQLVLVDDALEGISSGRGGDIKDIRFVVVVAGVFFVVVGKGTVEESLLIRLISTTGTRG